ncbi:hypothetical protein RJZ56_003657 [Blastomyces dermatitidis]|uniref:Uncharacterized protein n=3 Tax=Blastomyces TaxID=229219 RepID=A0A179U746_BLAGS|nr:uncharacterized protein BDBG_00258 [Blastomyces gilchristii SLH14081]XP_031575703.1 hypothetical protein, variant [Blastomyces gilchristii SLH14081]XP_045272971.1 uncharacterized protein BDCG_08426 [Blastomyces dermatitidis ER-3]XP_045282548.1 hypothetical protein, variant 1 [Blastomyces dermatitidis ER-3]XP_045282549.1 hypothetical protein, variant 2 [Blastomyces dermatitidis ER-3]XP_045282550.1 hypothetical protein, variant 3 [Blastomyces dermatitidis ER-3]EGE78211.1 hypothetical protein
MDGITETSELLPSPWTNYTQPPPIPLRNPFHYARSRSTTSSPLSSSPDSSPTSRSRRHHFSTSMSRMCSRSRSGSPLTMRSATSSLRLSSLLLRRRLSAVDLALSEERYRCCEDSVEKIGLGLMEPRPVDPIPVPLAVGDVDATINMNMNMNSSSMGLLFEFEQVGDIHHLDSLRIGSKPRFVMGGIFEVMEGSA